VWRDDNGKLQPSRFVNEQARQTMQVHPDGIAMRVFATIHVHNKGGQQALSAALEAGETEIV
jgi:hypothetical protein